MSHGIRISKEACKGCVNCIKTCPTEAMRVINGKVRIMEERCIGCGECLRSCRHRALSLKEGDWDFLANKRSLAVVADPAL
ncbi:MAG TPA: Fe-S cluster protein, partial [Thermovirga lienii]|nr:Fe-S cluster protein [Thermovirga lienii]